MFVAHGKNLQEARLAELFRCLDQDGFILTKELIENEDFIHHCLVTMRAVARTKRKEKIAIMAIALTNSLKPEYAEDRFEELFSVVDDITLREFRALNLLAKYELSFPKLQDKNALQRATQFWADFTNDLRSEFGIEEDGCRDFLKRIERTGCYAEISGSYHDYSGGIGYLTSTYFEIENLCKTTRSKSNA